MRRRAFTLTEILVVICIVALLAGVVLPLLRQAKERAYVVDDISRLRQIGVAEALYRADHEGSVLPMRCKPLVDTQYLPARLCRSLADDQPTGMANQILVEMAELGGPYREFTTQFPLSYLGLADFGLQEEDNERIKRQAGSGWLINPIRATSHNDSPYPSNWTGTYQRLTWDGAVLTRHFNQIKLGTGRNQTIMSTPIFLFCEPDSQWIKELCTQ